MRITRSHHYTHFTNVHLTDEEHGARAQYEMLMERGNLTPDQCEMSVRVQFSPYVTDYRFWDWLTGREVIGPKPDSPDRDSLFRQPDFIDTTVIEDSVADDEATPWELHIRSLAREINGEEHYIEDDFLAFIERNAKSLTIDPINDITSYGEPS